MSVFVPTGANVAVDPLDVLLVAPNGSTGTTLYLAQGQPVVVAALPAAVVAELNTAAGLVGPDTLFTTPVAASEWPSPVYIAGAQVKRVQPSGATNLGSMVLFALSGFMVTVPAVDLTAMVDLLNATTTGGGGDGGGPEWDVYTPSYTPGVPGVTASGDLMWYQIQPSNEEDAPAYFLAGFIDVNNSTMSPILNPQITVGLPPGAVTGDVVSFVLAPNNPAVRAWVTVYGPDASTFDIVVDELPASGSQYMQLIASFTPGAS